MATTFRLELKNQPTKAGKFVVYLRITQDRKMKRVKTSVELSSKKDWNADKQKVRASEPMAAVWNAALEDEVEKAKATYRTLKDAGVATTDKIKETIQAECSTTSFLQYAKQRTQEIYDAGGIANWKKYVGFCNKLEAFLTDGKGNVHDITFAEITPALLSKFEVFLHGLSKWNDESRKLHPNTIHEQFKIFKALIHRAISVEGLMNRNNDPFTNFRSTAIVTKKEKLTKDELQAMLDVELEEGSSIWHARNTFFFSLYCAGIRIADLLQLRWCNISSDGRISYQMGKNHKQRDLALVEQAKAILKYYITDEAKPTDYIFPYLDGKAVWAKAITQEEKDTLTPELKKKKKFFIDSKVAMLNQQLSKLAKMAGIEKKVSNHISRHSFARMAKDAGVDNLMVKEMLAHSKLQVTEGYMGNFATSATDEALQQIFSEERQEAPAMKNEAIVEALKGLSPEELAAIIAQVNKK